MIVDLTPTQARTLRRLLREEANRLGFVSGTERKDMTAAVRRLATISQKLQTAADRERY